MPNIGAAFSGGLENFMAQQAASKRQAMLDDLAIKRDARQAQSDLDAHNENIQTMHDHLTKMDEEKHANRVKAVEKWKATKVKGDIPSVEMMAEMKDLGMGDDFQSTPETVPGPTEGGQPLTQPGPAMYLGSTAERLAGAQKATEADMGKALEGVTDRAAASRIALKFGVPYAQVDDVVNAYVGKPIALASKPQSVQEYEYNNAELLKAGQKPLTYQQYQDQDANRKKVNTPVAGNGNELSAEFARNMGPAAFDMLSKKIALGGELPPFGMMGKGEKTAIIEALYKRAAMFNMSQNVFTDDPKFKADPANPHEAPNLTGNKAGVIASTGELGKLRGMQGAVDSFTHTANLNADALEATLNKLPDAGAAFLNKPFRSIVKNFGSENMAEFNVFHNSVLNEYNRITNNPTLAGVVSENARQDMKTVLDDNATVGAMRAAIKALKKESVNRKIGLDAEIKTVEDRIGNTKPAAEDTKKSLTKEDYRKKYNY